MTNLEHRDKADDKAVEDSFPPRGRGHDAIPTGHPTSDRHATETAHQWEDEEKGIDAARDLSSDEGGGKTPSSSRP